MDSSIWINDVSLLRFPKLEGDLKTDVLIIGGGMAGVLCAWQLARDGVDYALIEADRIGRGVTCNTTAKITSQHGLIYNKLLRRFGPDKALQYWQANEEALAEYRKIAKSVPCELESKDNYIYSSAHLGKLEKEMAALEYLGIPGEFVPSPSLPFATAGAVRFRNQAQFHPMKFLAGILPGLNIYENTEAKAYDGTCVETGTGRIRASKIIVATHFPIWNKHGGYFLKQYQKRSYVLAVACEKSLDGMYLDEAEGGISLRTAGNRLLIGGGSHRTGKKSSAWEPLQTFADRYYPHAKRICQWATQDCMTLDDVPYIGKYSAATPDLYVATGFNKWGMTSSMVAARLLGNLVQGREDPYEELFSPSRTILRPQLALNAMEATWNLLTPTRPRCPHLGCALKWNPRERSWDCPCHGSRFAEDGKLLDNPATGDMKNSRSSE